ncbi:MAG: PDZ domain-containing protein [Acidobacteria bacterium]|nr:PDZ domain-containing protein [Acidobacteriota bacterium]MCA1640258.1 PDZ domain-containing protein [Acidobacteriota bacterium]
MLQKLSVFVLLSIASCSIVNAQNQSSVPKEPVEKKAQRMILEMPFEESYLGVQTQEISKENMAQFNLREVRGVGVEKVSENSPAAQAGLQNGDVILKLNGEEVTSVRKLTRLISEVAPDHQARLTILRGGNEREITVTIGKRAMPKFENTGMLEKLYGLPGIPEYPNRPMPPNGQIIPFGDADKNVFVWRSNSSSQIGVGVTPLTKQLGDYFGISDGKGLLVNNVRENSPAAKAGLKAGDIIVEVEGKQVKETFDLIRAVNEKKEGDVVLTIVREKNRQTVRVTPEVSKDGIMPFKEFEKF